MKFNTSLSKPFARYPYLAISLLLFFSVYLIPHVSREVQHIFGFILSGIAVTAYFRRRIVKRGNYSERRKRESAIVSLLALEVFLRGTTHPLAYYASFPLFLFWVYLGLPTLDLILLLLIQATFMFSHDVHFPLVLLSMWVAFAWFYRSKERVKQRKMEDKLKIYEQETTQLEKRSEEVQTQLRAEERKKVHLVQTLREREKSFEALIEIVWKSFRAHTAALYLYDPQKEVFVLKERFTSSEHFKELKIQPLEGIFLAVTREKTPIKLNSPSGELRGLNYYDGTPEVKACVALPLHTQGILEGLILVDRLEAIPFTDSEVDTLELIGSQIMKAVDSAETTQGYFDLMEEFGSFYAAVSSLNRSLRVEDVVETLLDSTFDIAHYDLAQVILYEPTTETNRIVSERGEKEGFSGRTFACAPERGVLSWVIKNQTPLYYADYIDRHDRTPLFHKQLKLPNHFDSVLILPMLLKGESLGALLFLSRGKHAFSKSVRKMLEVIALQASATLKNARMVDQLERLATTDGLTGLINHRTFQEVLLSEMERAGRHPAPVSLLLADVDFFKKFNDEYGHPIGDFVLKQVGAILKQAIRKVDTAARYGGEEYAIILVNTPSAGALYLAERIVKEVAKTRFQIDGLTLRVTLSIGVASYPEQATLREDLIEKADRALYEAKRSGRNRALAFSESLKKLKETVVEDRLIEKAESEVRRMVDQTQ